MDENPFEGLDTEEIETPQTEGVVVERINKKDLKPSFDGNHEHIYQRDEEEEDGYYAETCTVKGCWMGRLIAK